MYKVLVVDDEEDIVELLRYNLVKEGYTVYTAGNGQEALNLLNKHVPDLILLDIMMPVMDGVETCKEIRKNNVLKNTFVVFLSARTEDYTQIAAYEAGADDYVTKPVKPKILISKIQALLRRTPNDLNVNNTIVKVGAFTIDRERYSILVDEKQYDLPRKEFELLALLASKTSKVFTREEILAKVWGNDVIVGDRTIDVHIRKLRERFGNDTIKTIKGVGYKLDV